VALEFRADSVLEPWLDGRLWSCHD
jgi:hypothetical protein